MIGRGYRGRAEEGGGIGEISVEMSIFDFKDAVEAAREL